MFASILVSLVACQPSLETLAAVDGQVRTLTVDETGAPIGWMSADDGTDRVFRWDGQALRTEPEGRLWPGAHGDCWLETDEGLARLIAGEPQALIPEPEGERGAAYGGGGDTVYATLGVQGALSIVRYEDGSWSSLSPDLTEGEPSLALLAATDAGLAFVMGDASSGAGALAWADPNGEVRTLADDFGDVAAASPRGDEVLVVLCDQPWCEGGAAALWRLAPEGAEELVSLPPMGDRLALTADGDRVWLALGGGAPEPGLWWWEGRDWRRLDVAYQPEIPIIAADGEGAVYLTQGGPWDRELEVLR